MNRDCDYCTTNALSRWENEGGALGPMTTGGPEQPEYNPNWQPEVWHPTQEERDALQRYEAMICQELANPMKTSRGHRRHQGRSIMTIK